MHNPKQFVARLESRFSRAGNLGQALIKGFIGIAGIKFIYAALGFVNAALLAKLMGPSGYGVYAYVLALVGVIAIPAEFGIPQLATREIAVANARQDWGRMRGLILRAHQAIGVLTLAMVCLAAVALLLWGDRLEPAKLECYALGLALVPVVALGALRGGMLRGLRKVIYGQLPERVVRPLVFMLLIAGAFLLLGKGFFLPSNVLALQIASAGLAFAVGYYLFYKHRPVQVATAEPVYRTAQWLKSSIPFGLTTALTTINGQTDIIALGIFSTDADVGTYRVAVQLATLVIFGLQIVNNMQGPHIAHLYAAGDLPRLRQMINRTSQVVLALAVAVGLAIALLGKPIIRLAFGEAYLGAYLPLVVLCAGQLVNAAMGSVQSLLNMTGHEREATKSVLIGALVNLTLCFSLIPLWGLMGAAVATSTTLVVWNVLMWRKVRQHLGIDASALLGLRK